MRQLNRFLDRATRSTEFGFLSLLAGVLFVSGCSSPERSAQKNMAESFVLTGVTQRQEDSPIRQMEVQRRGIRKAASVLIAPASVKASLAGYRGARNISLLMAPVFNIGDGIQMQMWLQDGGEPRLVCSRYIDPGRRYEDRAWIPVSVPVDISSDRPEIEIRISGGPRGDLTGDWLAFADMHVSAEAGER